MKKIYAVIDYKGHFGSKWLSSPYRSGYNKDKLRDYFKGHGFSIEFKKPFDLNFKKDEWQSKIVLMTSSEEPGLEYKRHLEDIAYGLEKCGAHVLPSTDLIGAHENKIKGAILQNLKLDNDLKVLDFVVLGNNEELLQYLKTGLQKFPCIVKRPFGSKGQGVFLIKNETELKRVSKKISGKVKLSERIHEKIRSLRHKGYVENSIYTERILIQEFVPNLKCDWKILIYGSRIYILRRNIKSNDFRASGSGFGYTTGSQSGFPIAYLEPLYQFFLKLKTPNLSLDFGFNGNEGFIFEFQALYFGTSTQFKSKDYYQRKNEQWEVQMNDCNQEQVFVNSIAEFIQDK